MSFEFSFERLNRVTRTIVHWKLISCTWTGNRELYFDIFLSAVIESDVKERVIFHDLWKQMASAYWWRYVLIMQTITSRVFNCHPSIHMLQHEGSTTHCWGKLLFMCQESAFCYCFFGQNNWRTSFGFFPQWAAVKVIFGTFAIRIRLTIHVVRWSLHLVIHCMGKFIPE